MTRVISGVASSSHHSIRNLKALADSCTNKQPPRLAIIDNMYMEGLLTGASDVEHATQLQDQIIATLKTACFDIPKWTSSVSPNVERLPASFCETLNEMIINSNYDTVKTFAIIFWSMFQINSTSQFAWTRGCQHNEENIIGSHEVVWPTLMVVVNHNSVAILLADSLDGQIDLEKNPIV